MAEPNPNQVPETVYSVFCGDINAATTQKFVQNLTFASNLNVKYLHIVFQSWGGLVGDGIFLYNFLRTFPVDVTLYNIGQIASAGVLAFLGAKHRKTTKNAIFMIHKSTAPIQSGATLQRLERVQKGLILDDARIDDIFRERLRLPDETWIDLINHDVNISGEEAIKFGIADELGEFSPEPTSKIFNVLV